MKKYLSLLLLLSLFCSVFAQQISVKSFRKLDTDLDARVTEPIKDQNGDLCAIIKVQTTQSGFYFDGGQLGIKKTELKHGEIWLYVPWGLKRLTISHDKLGVLRDYQLNIPIEKATVYELVLTTGKVITTVEETIDSQWLVINPEPADASVYLNDLFAKTGTYQQKFKAGSYTYRVEAPLYHTEAGKIEIKDSKKELFVKLKPAHGFININSQPEKDAKVIVDGKTLTQTTPCSTEALASGLHTVQVIREMYQPATQTITVNDGLIATANFTLQPTFAELHLTAPTEAKIYINNQEKGTGNWNGRLNAGVYSIEAGMDKYNPDHQDIELNAGDKKNINLRPTPIYGSLDVVTIPTGATIHINGNEFGTTPNTINRLLIGEYAVKLTKDGYVPVNKTVNINYGKIEEINEILYEKSKADENKSQNLQANSTQSYVFNSKETDIVINNPKYSGKSNFDDTKIIRITLTDRETIVYFEYTSKYDQNNWCNIDSKTYIQDYHSGKKYEIIKAINIEFSPNQTSLSARQKINFQLIFPPIPKKTTSLNLIENTESTWKFYNIVLK